MINKEQLLNGILTYVDNEIIPVLPTSNKWLVGTCVTLAAVQYPKYFRNLADNPMVQGLGVIRDNGMVDDVALFTALRANAQKYGKLTLTLPVVGSMSFGVKDVDKLREYVGGDNDEGRTEEDDGIVSE